MTKQREIDLSASVELPPMSTDQPPRSMTMYEFVEGWVLQSDGLKSTENLPKLFELDDALQAVKQEAVKKSGAQLPTHAKLPEDPGPNATPEQKAKYVAEANAVAAAITQLNNEYWRSVYDATKNMKLVINDEAFQSACTSVKAKLDELAKPNPMTGRTLVDPFVERKLLRLYFKFQQSKEVNV